MRSGCDNGPYVPGVNIARTSGRPFPTFLRERIFERFGISDTGFFVPHEKTDRFATSYRTDPGPGLPEIEGMIDDGLVTLQDAQMIRKVPKKK